MSQGWDWDAARGEGGLGIALSSLQDTLLLLPRTKVFVATGLYDLVTPYFATRWLLDQLSCRRGARADRSSGLRGRTHMYMRPRVRAALATDAASIFAAPPSRCWRRASTDRTGYRDAVRFRCDRAGGDARGEARVIGRTTATSVVTIPGFTFRDGKLLPAAIGRAAARRGTQRATPGTVTASKYFWIGRNA